MNISFNWEGSMPRKCIFRGGKQLESRIVIYFDMLGSVYVFMVN